MFDVRGGEVFGLNTGQVNLPSFSYVSFGCHSEVLRENAAWPAVPLASLVATHGDIILNTQSLKKKSQPINRLVVAGHVTSEHVKNIEELH